MAKLLYLYLLFSFLVFQVINEVPKLSSLDLYFFGTEQGYDLSDKNNKFFSDVCQKFTSENKKDVSLEYRRKYYFVDFDSHNNKTEDDEESTNFPNPYRTKIVDCLLKSQTFLKNYLFYLLIVIFLTEIILMNTVIFTYKKVGTFSPIKLITDRLKKKQNYLKYFIIKNINLNEPTEEPQKKIENNIKNNSQQKKYSTLIEENKNNNINNDTNYNTINTENNIIKDNEIEASEENTESAAYLRKLCYPINDDNNQVKKLIINQEVDLDKTAGFEDNCEVKNENVDDFIEHSINNQIKSKKMDEDVLTFGAFDTNFMKNVKKIYEIKDNKSNKSNKINKNLKNVTTDSKKILEKNLKSEVDDKQKVENFVFNKMNKNKYVQFSPNNPITKIETIYSKEELFYIGYNFAILEEKRSFLEIYLSILEFCQIFFMFNTPVKIYEEKKNIIIYYSIKIQLHLLISVKLITNSTLNKIYDNEFDLIYYFIHCLINAVISTILGEFVFYLLNAKRLYIKQKNKVDNFRLFNIYKKNKLNDVTTELVSEFLLQKLLICYIIAVALFIYTFRYSLTFFQILKNTRSIFLYCIIGSITITQISPFLLAMIPSYLRRKAINNKNSKLYKISNIIELLFIP